MKSPIRFIMQDHLQISIFTVAKERQNEFDTVLGDFELEYVDQPEWIFNADSKTKIIKVSRGAVELIWCASLAHFLFFYRLIQGKDFTEHREIDPHSDPDVDKALQLLHWALKNTLKPEEATEWPTGLPTPVEHPARGSDLDLADTLCLVTCGFMLHHELAHIALGYIRTKDDGWNIEQETDADNSAVDWLLGKADMDSNEFKGRILGLVQATVLTTALKMYGKILGGGTTHPFSYDRISSVVNRFKTDDRHTAKDMAYAILELHFVNSKRTWNSGSFENSGEALEALCNRLAEEAHGRIDRDGKKLLKTDSR